MTKREMWTVQQVAEYLDVKPDSARGQMTRWKIPRNHVQNATTGRVEARYDADAIRARRPEGGKRRHPKPKEA